MKTWISLCSAHLADYPQKDFVLETLGCFEAPFPRSDAPKAIAPPKFEHLEAAIEAHSQAFEKLSEEGWRSDVDSAQAQLFVRRLESVDELLSRLPEARIAETLQLGLRVRMTQIIGLGVWPAIRLRALADFYYSRAVVLLHGLSTLDPSELRSCAADTTWTPVVKDGIRREGIWEAHHSSSIVWGPQQITALKIDLKHFRLTTIDLRKEDGSHEELMDRLSGLGAIAGSSGGFFLYSEPDIAPPSAQYDPVGMILSGSKIAYPPIAPRAALLFADQRAELRRIGLLDVSLFWNETPLDLRAAVSRGNTETGPNQLSVSIVGSTIFAIGHNLPVPLNGLVLPWSDDYGPVPAPGSVVQWRGPAMSDGCVAQEGLSGGPLLLDEGRPCIDYQAEGFWGSAPPLTFSQDETGDRNLLARLVVGTDAGGFLYLVAVDGRQVDQALGLSLSGCAAWMQGLGCTRAANMDGGSSKRLVLHGSVLDSPTTEVAHAQPSETRLRPVYSGLAIIPRN